MTWRYYYIYVGDELIGDVRAVSRTDAEWRLANRAPNLLARLAGRAYRIEEWPSA